MGNPGYAENPGNLVMAINHALKGWPVIPLHYPLEGGCSCRKNCGSVAKHPMCKNGVKDGTTDLKTIQNWWTRWPHANIGIITGTAAKLIVIDIDPRNGGDESWNEITGKLPVPPTLTAQTSNNGFHLYYTSDEVIKNKVNLIPGVDVKAEGGYVVAPGSMHLSGEFYHWVNEGHPQAAFPESLKQLLNKPQPMLTTGNTEGIREGNRNSTLTRIAGFLRKNGFDGKMIEKALHSLNDSLCQQKLDVREVRAIANSIGKYETGESEWGPVKALTTISGYAPPFTSEHVPDPLRDWVTDIANRMQVPLEFILAPAIVSLSSLIGRQVGIYPKQKDDWLVVSNLWGATIARPGFFKSPAIAEALRPLDAIVKKAQLKYKSESVAASVKEEVTKAEIEGVKDKIKKATRKGNRHEVGDLQAQLEELMNDLDKCKRE